MTPSFPFGDYWWLYLAFTGLVPVLLAIDLTLHRGDRPISPGRAALWTCVWTALAVAFSGAIYLLPAGSSVPATNRQLTLEFLAGFVLEQSLSIDNMFVFALIFRWFGLPSRHQHRVLFYGVLGAIVFRALFIVAGSWLVRFQWVLLSFGLFLIFTGVRLACERDEHPEPGQSPVIRWIARVLPVSRQLHGSLFFVRLNGTLHATPLFVVMVLLETTDILFAVDSVPAVFGVTREPFIVFSSNIFAILGLRSMFFMLSDALDRFHLVKYGVASVLVFVGLKMVWLDRLFGGKFPIGVSLTVITLILAVSVVLSILCAGTEAVSKSRREVSGEPVNSGLTQTDAPAADSAPNQLRPSTVFPAGRYSQATHPSYPSLSSRFKM
jgi:tellurite resistance protein TerC